LLLGCGAHDDVAAPISLTTPVIVTGLGSASADSAVDFTLTGASGAPAAAVHTAVTALYAQLDTGDHPRLALLSMPLDDLQMSSGTMPPSGLALRDLTLELRATTAATMTRASDDALSAQATATVTLRGTLQRGDGDAVALGPLDLGPVPLDVAVTRAADGRASLAIDGRCDGVCWQLAGVATVRDARVHASVRAQVSPLE
jgi:hypothetical protein